MIPGFDVRTYFARIGQIVARHTRRANRSPLARGLISQRFATLLQKAGVSLRPFRIARQPSEVRQIGKGIAAVRQPSSEPSKPQGRRDPYQQARLRANRELAELFKLAQERDQVEWAAARLDEGWALKHIRVALASMPEGSCRSRGGLAARIAARDALASMPTASGAASTTAAAMIAAYNGALGHQS